MKSSASPASRSSTSLQSYLASFNNSKLNSWQVPSAGAMLIEEVAALVRQQLASYKKLEGGQGGVAFVDHIPREFKLLEVKQCMNGVEVKIVYP